MLYRPIRPAIAFALCMIILLSLSHVANAFLTDKIISSPDNTSSAFSFLKDNSIYFTTDKNGDFKKIFTAGENNEIVAQRLSPNGKYIAVIADNLERKYLYQDAPEESRNDPDAYINGVDVFILDAKGEVLIKLEPDNLVALDWNPDGNKFLCLTGDYDKNPAYMEWRPGDALSVYDVNSKEITSSLVAPKNDHYLDATWAEYDGNIYVFREIRQEYASLDGVFRYNFLSSELVPTPLKSNIISPDGKYCFQKSSGTSGYKIGLYSTGTEDEIPLVVPDKILRLDYLKRKDDKSYYRYFSGNLRFLTWIIEDGKSYAVLYDAGSSSLHEQMDITGFWKVDCETGKSEEMAAPKEISTYRSKLRNDYQMPAGLENGKLVWPVSDGKGGLKASTLEQ